METTRAARLRVTPKPYTLHFTPRSFPLVLTLDYCTVPCRPPCDDHTAQSLEEQRQYRFEPVGLRNASGVASLLPSASSNGSAQAEAGGVVVVGHGRRRGQGVPSAMRGMMLLELDGRGAELGEEMTRSVRRDEPLTAQQGRDDAIYYRPKFMGLVTKSTDDGIQKARPYRRIGDNGYQSLRDAISSSDARKKTVRTGTSLVQAIQKEQARSGIDGHLQDGQSRKRKTGRARDRRHLKLPQPAEAQPPDRSDEDAFLDVFFNPELAMKEMSEGFDKMRGSMVQRLDTVLQKLDESRVSGLESKFGILYGGLPSKQKRHLGPEETSEKWRLLAEKQRLESKLKTFVDHDWFLRLMAITTQSGRQMTSSEEHIMSEIKKTVEMGQAFDVLDFLTMVACVPRSYHDLSGVQRIFEFLRQKVEVKGEEYREFLEQRNLPVPSHLTRPSRDLKRKLWLKSTQTERTAMEGVSPRNPFSKADE